MRILFCCRLSEKRPRHQTPVFPTERLCIKSVQETNRPKQEEKLMKQHKVSNAGCKFAFSLPQVTVQNEQKISYTTRIIL